MGRRLYVGNVPFRITEDDLKDHFSHIGEVASIKLIMDPATGRFRGFCFVEMMSDEDAGKAIETLNGKPLMGRPLVINEAKPSQNAGPRQGMPRTDKRIERS